MSKCENCIHNVICSADAYFKSIDDCEKYCCHYKDKSLFVELPCKVGDKVYITDGKPHEVTECEITSFTIDCDGVGGFSYEPTNKNKWEVGFASCECLIAEWGDTVFLTKEDAEKKLREI